MGSVRQFQKLLPEGWHFVCTTKGGHFKLRHDSGAIYFTSATPSDTRSRKNMLSDLKRIARNERNNSDGD